MAGAGLSSIEDILGRIDNLLNAVAEVPGSASPGSEMQAETVAAAYRALKAEQKRAQSFGADMFLNPGWAILLHLFVSGAEGRYVNSAGICAAAGVPEHVALRHLAVLVAAKLVRREGSQDNSATARLMLTAAGEKRLGEYFSPASPDRDAAAA
jgi:DNA-binding MarR family transcriptional regulator